MFDSSGMYEMLHDTFQDIYYEVYILDHNFIKNIQFNRDILLDYLYRPWWLNS